MSIQNELIKHSAFIGYTVDKNGVVFNKNGKVVSLSIPKRKTGYKSFNIRLPGRKATRCFVHRLQAFQKYGDAIFQKGQVVRHINGDYMDNSFNNIEIGTQSQNMMDIPKDIRVKKSSHPKYCHKSILNDVNNGYSYRQIMDKYGISSKGTVSFIVNKSLEKF
jgi:hypothetical protein